MTVDRKRKPAEGELRGAMPPGPVLAVCGWSGSGKTTVLAAVIPRLVERGLAAACPRFSMRYMRLKTLTAPLLIDSSESSQIWPASSGFTTA